MEEFKQEEETVEEEYRPKTEEEKAKRLEEEEASRTLADKARGGEHNG